MSKSTPQIEHLRYATLVLRKRAWMMLAVGLGTFAAVQFFGYLVTPVWEGTTLVLVERTAKQNLDVFREVNIPVGGSSRDDTALQLIPLLTGWNMAYDIVREFHLDDRLREKRFNPPTLRDVIKNAIVDIVYAPLYLIRGWEEPNWADKAAEDFVEDWIDIEEEEEKTGVINLTVYGETPAQAADIANAMAVLLDKRTQEFSRARASLVYDSVARQVAEAEANVRRAEREVADFQKANSLYGPEENHKLLVQRLDQQRIDLEATRRLQGELAARAAGPLDQFIQPNLNLSPVIRQIEASLVTLNARRSAMVLEKTPAHPDVLVLDAEIRRNQQHLEDALRAEREMLAVRATELEQDIRELESEILSMPEAEMKLASLRQVLAVNRSVFETSKSRLEQLAMERQSLTNDYNIRILDRAIVPPGRDQDWPLWWLNILVGIVLGIVAGVGGAFVVEYWSEPVRGRRDVEETLGLRLLGRFPDLGRHGS